MYSFSWRPRAHGYIKLMNENLCPQSCPCIVSNRHCTSVQVSSDCEVDANLPANLLFHFPLLETHYIYIYIWNAELDIGYVDHVRQVSSCLPWVWPSTSFSHVSVKEWYKWIFMILCVLFNVKWKGNVILINMPSIGGNELIHGSAQYVIGVPFVLV